MQLINHSATSETPTVPSSKPKLSIVWVKKIDSMQREYLAAVWTVQD